MNWGLYAPEESSEWIDGEAYVRWVVCVRACLVCLVGGALGGLGVGLLL